jgi:hypothetical protein
VPPTLTATIGLHGSASTWVFNTVRDLLNDTGADDVLACYAESIGDLPRLARHLLLKSHHGTPELDAWLSHKNALIILSLRDPRDACLSMARRFNASLAQAAAWIAQDCNRLARLAAEGHKLLRYEDRFFDHPETVAAISRLLGLNTAPEIVTSIFTRYRTETMRAFAQTLDTLPPDRLLKNPATKMDRLTQIHANHIGDASSGKWQGLPMPDQAELTRIFSPFLDRFGYPR